MTVTRGTGAPRPGSPPSKRNDLLSGWTIVGQVQRVGPVVLVLIRRHIDDERLVHTDVLPTVIQIRWDHKQSGIAVTDPELVEAPIRRRVLPPIEHHDRHETVHHEKTIRRRLMQSPR